MTYKKSFYKIHILLFLFLIKKGYNCTKKICLKFFFRKPLDRGPAKKRKEKNNFSTQKIFTFNRVRKSKL